MSLVLMLIGTAYAAARVTERKNARQHALLEDELTEATEATATADGEAKAARAKLTGVSDELAGVRTELERAKAARVTQVGGTAVFDATRRGCLVLF